MNKQKMNKLNIIGTLGVVLLLIGTALAFTEDYLPAGTAISVDITAPSDGAVKVHPPGNVELEGTAIMGEGVPIPDTLIVYVLDASGSTATGGGCGGDQNNDGNSDTIMDCEIAAAKELNGLAVTTGTVGEVGVAVFASTGTTADVGPGTGEQLITGPDSDVGGASGWDVEEVLSSVYSQYGATGGVNLFTPKTVSMQTNFADGLTAAVQIVSASTVSNKIIVFMSDGGGSGSVMLGDLSTVTVPGDVIIKTFAIGSGSSCSYGTGSTTGSLDDVAAKGAAGSSCTPVPTVSDLPNVIPGVIAAELLSLERNVDGGAFTAIPNSDIDPDLPAVDPVTVTFDHSVSLSPGIHTLCVKATGSDSGGMGSVTDCIDVTIATIDLTPETDVNELPAPDHTVTAKVEAGSDGGVPGVLVNFDVLSGPNAGASASDTTDGNGEATFTYTATQCPTGLGTDTIEACFSDEQGDEVCDTATKEWVDTTPPEIACPADVTVEQETADGTEVPLTATATDLCDEDPTIISDVLAIYPLGPTIVTFTATDFSGNSASCTTTVTVVDTTPPDISVTVSPDTLWPPNHKMVDIAATVEVSDICDAAPTVVLTSVTSDEPDNDQGKPYDPQDSTSGDGNTDDDIQGADIGTEDYEFQLRAERAGAGDGRDYTITYEVTDASGNSASTSATVVVPHDMA